MEEEEWKKKYGYGKRWAAESYLSAVKRIFDDEVGWQCDELFNHAVFEINFSKSKAF